MVRRRKTQPAPVVFPQACMTAPDRMACLIWLDAQLTAELKARDPDADDQWKSEVYDPKRAALDAALAQYLSNRLGMHHKN